LRLAQPGGIFPPLVRRGLCAEVTGFRNSFPQGMSLVSPSTRTTLSGYLSAGRMAAWLGLASLWLAASVGCGGLASQGLNAEGVRLFDQTRYPEAVEQFQRAIDRDPSNPDGYYNLAAAYHRMGVLNGQAADLTQAERYYYLCLDRDPDHRECYRGLGVLLVEQNRTEEAFRLLQGWADRRPNSPDPKIELARLYEELGDRDRAKQQLADALLVDAANSRALAALGRLREQDGDRLQALNNYQQSLAANRFQPDVASRVSSLQSSMGGSSLGPAFSQGTQTVSRGPSPVR
jgi:tetratricopeptide (TPR) repeat protein